MRPFYVKEIQEIVGGRFTHLQPAALTVTAVKTNSRECGEGDVFFALVGERLDGHDFVADAVERGAAAVVIGRDVPRLDRLARRCAVIRVEDTTRALGLLAAEYRKRLGATVIAITGSVGKTTVKGMVHHILRRRFNGCCSPKSFNNHIGVPLTLFSATGGEDYVLLELGTNHPGEIAQLAHIARPDISVVTAVCPTHCEGLGGDLAGIAREKGAILDELPARGLAVLNGDDPHVFSQRRRFRGRVVLYGTGAHCDLRAEGIGVDRQGIRFRLNDRVEFRLPVIGRHNVHNALAAIAVAQRQGVEWQECAAALADVALPDMRLQVIQADGLTVINDAYNASPASMTAALAALEQVAGRDRKVAVLGDMLELGRGSVAFHRQLGREAAAAGLDLLIAVGRYSKTVARFAVAAGMAPDRVVVYENTAAVCRAARRRLRGGEVVLVKGSRRMALEKLVEKLTAARTALARAGG